jgi:hypothetical protein
MKYEFGTAAGQNHWNHQSLSRFTRNDFRPMRGRDSNAKRFPNTKNLVVDPRDRISIGHTEGQIPTGTIGGHSQRSFQDGSLR